MLPVNDLQNRASRWNIYTHKEDLYVQRIDFEENEPSTEEKKPQMCKKCTVAAILFFKISQKIFLGKFLW